MPPPDRAVLWAMVVSMRFSWSSSDAIPPPPPPALLPRMRESVTVTWLSEL